VFACFVDLKNAFDMVNYWQMFRQMLDDGVDVCYVKLLAFRYSHQTICILAEMLLTYIQPW